MPYTKSGTAYNSIKSRNNKLERTRKDILKQLSQMDLENNAVQESITEIVQEMIGKIDQIKSQLSGYYFE